MSASDGRETDSNAGGTKSPARSAEALYRLRPNHGVLFVDFEIPTEHLAGTQCCFIEDVARDEHGERPVLLPLDREVVVDGTIWHPVTLLPLKPTDTLWLTGYDGIEPFLDTWIPVPYFRLVESGAGVAERFDSGPFNWVRLFLCRPDDPVRSTASIKAVLAIDTRLSGSSRFDGLRYLAPAAEDATFGSTFGLAHAPSDLATFIGEPWVDGWIGEIFLKYRSGESVSGLTPPRPPRFQLEHAARYLTLLSSLKAAVPVPRLRFYDSVNRSLIVDRDGLDLIIDMSTEDTVALVINRRGSGGTQDADKPRVLALRDLSWPGHVHKSAIPTAVEFDGQPFGNARQSRRSGRSDAFFWPSMVRIGEEARRLSLRANATTGVTGLTGLTRHANDATASASVWRFSTDAGGHEKPGPMAVSPAMDHLTEDGQFIEEGSGGVPALRPRFSRSALIGMFIAELVLHTVSAIAAPARDETMASRSPIQDLRSITLTLPVSISEEERQAILERAGEGVDLVWRAQGWEAGTSGTEPKKPQVHASIGADLGPQLLYLHDEVDTRFGGDFRAFADATARPANTTELGSRVVRIASLDIDIAATTIIDAEYEVTEAGRVVPRLARAERVQPGTRAIYRAVLESHLLPAIEAELHRCGLPAAGSFLREITGRSPASWQIEDSDFEVRLEHKLLRPAARTLVDLVAGGVAGTSRGIEMLSLAGLVETGQGRLDPLAHLFNGAAARAGASGFRLERVQVAFNAREIRATMRREVDALLSGIGAVLDASERDLVIVAGGFAGLKDLADGILSLWRLSPHRLIVFGEHRNGLLTDIAAPSAVAPQRLAGALGGLIAGRGMLDRQGLSNSNGKRPIAAERQPPAAASTDRPAGFEVGDMGSPTRLAASEER